MLTISVIILYDHSATKNSCNIRNNRVQSSKVGDNMGKKEKLIARLKSKPKDFSFDELRNLLELLGFEMTYGGKTGGSRVKFKKSDVSAYLHKPHPRKELLAYQVKYILEMLQREGLI